jgi:Flp pilus assembly protein CpaB
MLVRSPRALAFRAGAAVVAVATAALVASDLAALHRRAHDFGPPRDALVARHDLPLGITIHAGDVRIRRVHASQVPPGVLDDAERVVGRVVTVPVLRDGFVAARNLAPRPRTGLDGAIPRGMRAVRIVVTDSLRPRSGAAVDVLASFERGNLDAPTDLSSGSATVVAHAVLVVSTDSTHTAEGAGALGVTLLVTPREARDVVFAATHGAVTVALVPPEDARVS